jgi:hypothetical protein
MAEYQRHDVYLRMVAGERAKRAEEIGTTIRETLGKYVVPVQSEQVQFGRASKDELKELLLQNPTLLKPLIAACNMGKRAIRKDLGIELDTFRPRLTEERADEIAGYLLPSLPQAIVIEALVALDAYQWVDSAIRKQKGRWERQFLEGLKARGVDCKKRKFKIEGQEFELDIAYPSQGDILLGADVKMIGHPSDKHKRGDEIVNKAVKYKKAFPGGTFVSLVYYPFDEDRHQLEDRLRTGSEHVSDVVFAGDDEESVRAAIERLYTHARTITLI